MQPQQQQSGKHQHHNSALASECIYRSESATGTYVTACMLIPNPRPFTTISYFTMSDSKQLKNIKQRKRN